MDKRDFLKTSGGALGALFASSLWTSRAGLAPAALARDDAFWDEIRRQYLLTPDYINLENGYFLMQSQPVLDAFVGHVRAINLEASHYMRTRQFDDKRAVAGRIAGLLGCAPEELIITRNTTESLDTIIHAFDWHAGDEAVMAEQDYGAMLDMFRLQARRYGIVNKVVSLPHDPQSDDEIVNLYESQITPKTRLLMVCHLVNITGQILPVAKITAMAHRHNVLVMVDGAHAFAHLDFKIADLGGCDFYGSSLHKWLGTPLGAGMLYVRRDRIHDLWPIFADMSMPDDDIRKLNHTGTHAVWTDLALNEAIDFHAGVGIARKEARMRYLQRYWTDQVRGVPGITLNTPTDPRRSCGIANVGVDKLRPGDLAHTLLERYRIWTVAIDGAGVHGARITPHLFTTTEELDSLVRALKELAA
ncbi:MAG TPA: aminotransferase class V-fold PLP-dependent enzyme [Gemmatimonadales bacterium]|jgi:selenocysteine lyase/cysteine desulfurase